MSAKMLEAINKQKNKRIETNNKCSESRSELSYQSKRNGVVETLAAEQAKEIFSHVGGKALLNVKEIGEVLGIGEKTVYGMINNGQLPIIRIGKTKMVSVIAIINWIIDMEE